MKGLIFDIKEFALNDGDGIRTTVFMKGCPLHCAWCHNPEGLSAQRELYIKKQGCTHCGLCKKPCNHPDCQGFERCLHICPHDLVSIAGTEWEGDALAHKLLSQADVLKSFGGGITISGGEPLLQSQFCSELLAHLRGKIHTAIETSGCAAEDVFKGVISLCDFVYMDLKLYNNAMHIKYTGVGNEQILKNAEILRQSGIPHCFRTPLIPNITDTEENLSALKQIVGTSKHELLAYNALAPAKYEAVGREFTL